jgi:hypothetical protein
VNASFGANLSYSFTTTEIDYYQTATYTGLIGSSGSSGSSGYSGYWVVANTGTVTTVENWGTANVIPQKSVATQDASVDSRLDKRYTPAILLNKVFNPSVFRGGLFVGNDNDNSVVGRAFAEFNINASGTQLWPVGDVCAYFVQTGENSGTVTVNLDETLSSWSPSTIDWSIQPTVASHPYYQAPFNNGATSYALTSSSPQWCNWEAEAQTMNSALTGQPFSVEFQSTNESNDVWGYFAKSEYLNGAFAPYVLYASGSYTAP